MSYWETIDRRLWVDEKVRQMSGGGPGARPLWLYLLTGPHCASRVPGLFEVSFEAIERHMGWPAGSAEPCMDEIESLGMLIRDRETNIVFLRNRLRYAPTPSQNHVAGWMRKIDEIANGAPKAEWLDTLRGLLEARGPQFVAWLDKPGIGRPMAPPSHAASHAASHDQSHGHPIGHLRNQDSGFRTQDQEEEKRVPSAPESGAGAPALASGPVDEAKSQKRSERQLAEWDAWCASLVERFPDIAPTWIAALEKCIDGYYAARGGIGFTPARRAYVARNLGKLKDNPVDGETPLLAIEIYCDAKRGYDERYLVGIARRLNTLTEKEFEYEAAAHRKSCPHGLITMID